MLARRPHLQFHFRSFVYRRTPNRTFLCVFRFGAIYLLHSLLLCFAVASRRLMPVAILYLQFRALSNIGNCFGHLCRIKTDMTELRWMIERLSSDQRSTQHKVILETSLSMESTALISVALIVLK